MRSRAAGRRPALLPGVSAWWDDLDPAVHGSPYDCDRHVPLMVMGKRWIKPGAYGQYAEVVDIAPTLAHLLHLRPPAGSEGRVLLETLR